MQDLDQLLASLDPRLDDTVLVYVVVPDGADVDPALREAAIAHVAEDEGTTLVVPADVAAAHGAGAAFPCRRITLRVHSALEAVGLTAVFAGALAAEGIPANVLAGFHHDHVLVPVDDAERARTVLVGLARASQVSGSGNGAAD